jgi:hypothetical protein
LTISPIYFTKILTIFMPTFCLPFGASGFSMQPISFLDSIVSVVKNLGVCKLEQLQQFAKPTWHPSDFGKTRKIGLQQFGKPTWQK